MQIAIVHDYLNQMGGAERVLMEFHEIYPEAPIYTSIYAPEKVHPDFKSMDIRTSFMQRLPFMNEKDNFKKYLPLYPIAIRSFDLKKYDAVLTSSSAFAKGIRKGRHTCHICYCHTPMRFVWDYENYISRENFGPAVRTFLPLLIKRFKRWDISNTKGVDYFIANSENVRERIKKYYNREADIIYPPVDTKKFYISENIDSYFLIVSRLNSYKGIDIAIRAFNRLGYSLKIIGDGPYGDALKRLAGKNVEFLGRVGDDKLACYYSRCQALVVPGEEDFGIVPLEAMASGRPVVAYAGGGALETVAKEETGELYYPQTPEALIEALKGFSSDDYDSWKIRRHAESFDSEVFRSRIKEFIDNKFREYKEKGG